MLGQCGFARFHRTTRDENHRDIEPHGGVQHTGGDLVAIGNTDHGIGAVRVDHVLHRIGDKIPGRQAIEHAVVAHGNTVVHGNGVELFGDAASRFDLTRHQLPQIFEVHVAGHELGERIHHRDDGLLKVLILHAGCAPQGAGACHIASGCRGARSILGHRILRVVMKKRSLAYHWRLRTSDCSSQYRRVALPVIEQLFFDRQVVKARGFEALFEKPVCALRGEYKDVRE